MANVMSMFDSSVDELSFKMKAGKHDEAALVVAGFQAEEGLSTLFTWNINVVIDPDTTPTLNDTLGLDAEFQILRDGKPLRIVRGIIGHVTPHGESGHQRLITLTIVPRLAELQFVTDSRIFQDRPVNEIVEELLRPHSIEVDWRVVGRPPPRSYRVQKNETDYQFCTRILADAGFHFHFAHTDEVTKLTVVSDAHGYEPIEDDDHLPYREIGGAVTVDHVGSADQRQRLRPGSVVMRDYDFQKSRSDQTARHELDGPHNAEKAPRREVYVYPGDYTNPDSEGKSLAQRRLEESRSDTLVFSGRSSCVQLEVGRKFTLEQHPDDTFNRELLVTRTEIRGQRAGILVDTGRGHGGPGFVVSFFAVPSDAVQRPPRVALPPVHPESARVVGPEQGSPFVDDHGRVKVQFHWDREGKWDEKSSCWLRVMTPSAGGDRGIWFPPRVGDEVIVQYLDGDVDRPFVAGAIYNVQQPQPHALPHDVSKSTIKGLSIPGGKGFNELTFEDRSGKEEIYLHAQKDRRTVVLHNHAETVGANQTSSIGANRTDSIGANETVSVGANRTETVGAKENVTIGKGRSHTVSEGHDVLTLPKDDRTVNIDTGNHTRNVKLLDKTEADNHEVHARYDAHMVGDRKIHIAQKGAQCIMEDQHIAFECPEHIGLNCPSGHVVLKDKKVELRAEDELLLVCGQASVSLKKDGTITLKGGKELLASVASSLLKLEPAKATLSGPMTDVVAKAITKVVGALVKIN